MGLEEKSKRVNVIFTSKEFEDDAIAFEFKGKLLNSGLPSIDCLNYAFIFHYLDIIPEDRFTSNGEILHRKGEFKTPHFHLWCECKVSRRLGTVISKLAQSLDFDPQLISCERAVSMEGSLQYLIHRNDPDKHQYDIKEIMTNIEPDELRLIMERPAVSFSVDFIVESWRNSVTVADFVKTVGLERCNQYYKVISALTGGFRK